MLTVIKFHLVVYLFYFFYKGVFHLFKFLKPSPDATNLVPKDKIPSVYRRKQTGVILATCFTYLAYYIIRLIFTTEQKPVMKEYGFNIGQIGLILSTFGIGYGVAKLFM